MKLTQTPRTSSGTELGRVILGSCPDLSPLHTQGIVVNLCPRDSDVNHVGEDKATLGQLAREAWCVGFWRDEAMFEEAVHSRLVWVDRGKISHVGCDT